LRYEELLLGFFSGLGVAGLLSAAAEGFFDSEEVLDSPLEELAGAVSFLAASLYLSLR
jgi:hypothetical protein